MDAKTDDTLRAGRERRRSVDFSIVAIIPLYNGARWIEQSIASVLAQTLPPDEFIVVDDGSTDEGPAIVERLAKQHSSITLLRKPNGGQSSARNFGVQHSTGDLIALLDQDDLWYPNHIEELSAPFREEYYPPLGWVYSNLDEIDETGESVQRAMLTAIPVHHPKLLLKRCLSEDMFVLPSASLISRTAFEAVGGFDERLSGYEDDDLFLRLFRRGYTNIYIDRPLSQWRMSATSCSYTPRMAKSRMIYARKLVEAFPNDLRRNQHWTRDLIAPRFLRTLAFAYATDLRTNDRAGIAVLVSDIEEIGRYLGTRRRWLVRLALPFLRRPWLARIAYRFLPIMRRILPR